MKRNYFLGLLTFLIVVSIACTPSVHQDEGETQPLESFTTALFDPSAGVIPFPNDLLINRTTGLVAIPNPDGLDAISSVNSLNGFSTTSAISFYMDGMPASSSVNSQTIMVFDLTAGTPQFGTTAMMSFMPFDPTTGAQSMVPAAPLKSAHKYLCVVTKGVTDSSGKSIEPSQIFFLIRSANPLVDADGRSTTSLLDDSSAAQLEMLRQAMSPAFDFLAAAGISRTNVALAFTFTTQDITGDMMALKAQVDALDAPTPIFTGQYPGEVMVNAFFAGVEAQTGYAFPHDSIGGVYTGAYMSANYVTHPVAGYFMKGADGSFVKISDEAVPFILTVPAGTGPFPVVLYQHGITSSKESMFAIANTFAQAGIATIAPDMVLHGDRAGDYIDNATGAPGPDGILDPSGSLFINLTSLRTVRDNMKQVTMDQVQLIKMLKAGVDFSGDGYPDLSPYTAHMSYLGVSLGAIVGTNLMAVEPDIKTAVLNVPGGYITQLLVNSPTFGPVINAGLEAAAGLQPGTADYNQFMLMVQTTIDSSDPINYAGFVLDGSLCGVEKNILVHEAMNETVIPNAFTEMLGRAFGSGLQQIEPIVTSVYGMTSTTAGGSTGFFQYDIPAHSFLLAPVAGMEAYTYYGQLQTATYFGMYFMTGTPVIIDPFSGGMGKVTAKDAAADWAFSNTLFSCPVNASAAVYIK